MPSRANDFVVVADANTNPEGLLGGDSSSNEILLGALRFTGMPGQTFNPDYSIGLNVKGWAVRYLDSSGGPLLRSPASNSSYYVNYSGAGSVPSATGENNVLAINQAVSPPPGYPDYPLFDLADITIPADGIIDIQIVISDPSLALAVPSFQTTDCYQTIDAVDDDYGTVVAGTSTTGVLVNDRLDNTKQATTLNVGFTNQQVTAFPPGGAASDLVFNADGTISVAVGALAGDYALQYTICDSSHDTVCDTATVTLAVTAAPTDLRVSKTASSSAVVAGQQVMYTLAVDNLGPADATNVVLTDTPGVGLDCQSGGLPVPSCAATGGAICPTAQDIATLTGSGWVLPSLPVGGAVEVEFACLVTASGLP